MSVRDGWNLKEDIVWQHVLYKLQSANRGGWQHVSLATPALICQSIFAKENLRGLKTKHYKSVKNVLFFVFEKKKENVHNTWIRIITVYKFLPKSGKK